LKIEVQEATVTSNVPKNNVTTMAIDVEGMAHIMGVLTNLYKDPELAVIREYYTNGVDAHIAAGNTAPVLVTLPSWDSPNYTVQDFGVGMSEWDIKNVYSQYGASTKRNSNKQVGAFGLGCKSAFTITNQFTVVSVKDGERVTTLFTKHTSGSYEANVISKVKVDAPNGTTVSIPVPSRKLSEFLTKAKRFFAFSAPDLVLVDGVAPESALESSERIEDPNDASRAVYLRPKQQGDSYVIMGNIPYELSRTEIESSLTRIGKNRGYSSTSFVQMPKYLPVPIGSVDLTPSREGLMFTEKTQAVIDSFMSFILEDMKKIAQDSIDQANTLEEYFESREGWARIVEVGRLWKGESVPQEITLSETARTITRNSWGASNHSESTWFRLDKAASKILVKGFSADKYKKVNGYLTPYMTAKGLSSATFVITDAKDLFDNKWIKLSSKLTIVDASDIIEIGREQRKKERKDAAGSPAKRDKVKYPVLFIDEEQIQWTSYDLISDGTPYLHSSDIVGQASTLIRETYGRMYDRAISTDLVELFQEFTDSNEIILLSGNRTVDALEKRVKGTESLLPAIKEAREGAKKLATADVIRHHAVASSGWKRFLKDTGLDKMVTTLKDETIVQIIEPTPATKTAYAKYLTAAKAQNYFQPMGEAPFDAIGTTNVTKELDRKYPLIDAINTWSLDTKGQAHIVKYLNLIHEESVSRSV
jgi:Histidine kinase-, DNA gyrase B-, and HSP90-like ATPase